VRLFLLINRSEIFFAKKYFMDPIAGVKMQPRFFPYQKSSIAYSFHPKNANGSPMGQYSFFSHGSDRTSAS